MRIRLLCLAVSLFMASEESHAQSSAPDPFAGDDRLKVKQTLTVAGSSFQEFLKDLSAKTGIQFRAHKDVAEDKLVLFSHDRPMDQTLRAVARHFRFTWEREGSPGSYSYTLIQSLRQKREEEKELDEQLWRTAEQIRKEIALCLQFEGKSAEELKNRLDELKGAVRAEAGAKKRSELNGEMLVLSAIERNAGGTMTIATFLRAASVEDIVRLMKSGPLEFVWPAAPGKDPIPQATLEEIKAVVLAQNIKYNNPNRDFNFAKLSFRGTTATKPTLTGMIEAGVATGGSRSASGPGFNFPLNFVFDRKFDDDDSIGPADWEKNEKLTALVDSVIAPPQREFPSKRRPLPPTYTAQVLASLQASLPIDVISDSFYSQSYPGFNVKGTPLGKALGHLCSIIDHAWDYHDGFVFLGSRHYAAARLAEPPVSSLTRWAAMKGDELLTLDHLSEIAALPYPRYETAIKVLQDNGILGMSTLTGPARNHLAFWSLLTTIQRNAAQSKVGLAYRFLRPELRRAFELASLDKLAAESYQSSNQEREWPTEELMNATFRVDRDEKEMWGIRTGSGWSASGGTREAVYEKLKKNNPTLTIDMVKPCRSGYVWFRYTSPGFNASGSLNLPLRWLDDGNP